MSWDPLRHQSLHHDIVGSDVIYDIIRNDVINLVFMYGLVSMLNLVFMYSLVLVYWFPLISSIPAPCMTCSSGIINDIIGNDIINLGWLQASLSLIFMYNFILVYLTLNLCCACVL